MTARDFSQFLSALKLSAYQFTYTLAIPTLTLSKHTTWTISTNFQPLPRPVGATRSRPRPRASDLCYQVCLRPIPAFRSFSVTSANCYRSLFGTLTKRSRARRTAGRARFAIPSAHTFTSPRVATALTGAIVLRNGDRHGPHHVLGRLPIRSEQAGCRLVRAGIIVN